MFSIWSADELVARAAQLSPQALDDLGNATRRALGRGLLAWLGIRTGLHSPTEAAHALLEAAGREAEWQARSARVDEAILESAIRAGASHTRDTSGVRPAWSAYQQAVVAGDGRRRSRTHRSARRVFRRGLGRSISRNLVYLFIGADSALLAILTWDLVADDGSYTVQDRDMLTRAWTAAAPFPRAD